MITIYNTRDNGMIHEYAPQVRSVEQALLNLLKYELGFGGQVVESGPAGIVTHTRCMGTFDVMRFEGPEPEILLLRTAAAVFSAAHGHVQTECFEPLFKMLSAGRGGVRAFDVVHIMPMMFGEVTWRCTAAAVCGLDPSDVERVLGLSDDDFVAAMELARETGCGLYEIATLVSAAPAPEASRA